MLVSALILQVVELHHQIDEARGTFAFFRAPCCQDVAETFICGVVVEIAHNDDGGVGIGLKDRIGMVAKHLCIIVAFGNGGCIATVARSPMVDKKMYCVADAQQRLTVEDVTVA